MPFLVFSPTVGISYLCRRQLLKSIINHLYTLDFLFSFIIKLLHWETCKALLGSTLSNIHVICYVPDQDHNQIRERPLDFQGGLGFSVWPEYFFLSLSGPKYFFSNYHGPEYFFLKPYRARIFCSLQYKFGSNFFSCAANRLQNDYIEVVCCLSVCVSDRDDFKWHNIASYGHDFLWARRVILSNVQINSND